MSDRSLAMAYELRRRNKRKMANGGMIEDEDPSILPELQDEAAAEDDGEPEVLPEMQEKAAQVSRILARRRRK